MKHCDRGFGDVRSRLSPLARPFTFASSSSSVQPRSSSDLSLAAPESEPEDSIWGDYAFDLSFLTSDDQISGGLDDDSLSTLSRDADAATTLLKEGSGLFGQAAYTSVKDQRITPEIMRQDNIESFLGLSDFLESDLRSTDVQPQVSPSIPVISANQSNSIVNSVEACVKHFSSTSVLGLSDFIESDLKSADFQPQVSPSVPVIATNQSNSVVNSGEACVKHFSSTSVLRHTGTTPAVNGVSVANINSSDIGLEGQLPSAKQKVACFGNVLMNQSISENNPNSFFSKTSELRIRCSIGADNDKLDLTSAYTTGVSEKSSIPSDQDDSEVDSPSWRGTQSYNTLASSSRAMSSRRSSDDLNRFYGLNPLAPQFIPASARKSSEKHVKECEESSSSSLKKSLSSTFPLSSGDYSLTEIPNKVVIQQSSSRTDRATGASFLTQGADQSFGFVSQDSLSNSVKILDSRSEFQTSKKLDPSAPVFVPAGAKLNAAMHKKQAEVDRMVEFETNAHSAAVLSSLGNRLLNNIEAEMCPAEVLGSFGNRYSNVVHEPGTSDSFNPWLGSEGGISDNASMKNSNDKLCGRHILNSLGHMFSLADTKQNVDGCGKNHATDDPLPVMNSAITSASSVYEDRNVICTAIERSKSSLYVEPYSSGIDMAHPSKLLGSSSLMSSVPKQSMMVEDRFKPVEQLVVEPKVLLVKGNKDSEHLLPFHISKDSASPASSNMKALSELSQRPGCPSSLSSPKMDVKKLLTTMRGLSELLTLVQGHSCGADSPNEKEVILINCIVQNLNLYMRNRVEGHSGNSSNVQRGSYDPKQFANMHKPPGANDMTVNLDFKREEKCSAVSGEIVPHSHLSENVVSSGNVSAQVIADGVFQQNHPAEEQINPQVLYYRSLWLKAEAERCLIEYEASLARMKL